MDGTSQQEAPETSTAPLTKRTRTNSKERRDKGTKLITRRDRVVIPWIAEQYAARADQAQELLSRMPGKGGRPVSPTGLTVSAVLQVIDHWVALGLVEYRRIYEGEPGWLHVTSFGIRTLHLPYAMLTPATSTLPHLYHINRVRLDMERRHPDFRWTSERTLRAAQPRREEGIVVPHLPDAQVRTPKLVGVEVERSPKSDKELDDILTELLITGSPSPGEGTPVLYTTVWYFVRPETRTSVEQARDRLPPDCHSRVKILSLETLTEFPPQEETDAAPDD
ncbi:MAG: hypothetical protein ACRDIV_17960 [Ktedonobacteraceae bacterium]